MLIVVCLSRLIVDHASSRDGAYLKGGGMVPLSSRSCVDGDSRTPKPEVGSRKKSTVLDSEQKPLSDPP